ncbi:hypothetical protein [Comamonas odontotermitis]|uniref:hypothetical protein n=1 Tax=Comamonas odontotermitis TaxID=379895 RepID=UPI0037537185
MPAPHCPHAPKAPRAGAFLRLEAGQTAAQAPITSTRCLFAAKDTFGQASHAIRRQTAKIGLSVVAHFDFFVTKSFFKCYKIHSTRHRPIQPYSVKKNYKKDSNSGIHMHRTNAEMRRNYPG